MAAMTDDISVNPYVDTGQRLNEANDVLRQVRAVELGASERIAYAQAYATLAIGHALFGLLQQQLEDRESPRRYRRV
jgi:hypothetical protein